MSESPDDTTRTCVSCGRRYEPSPASGAESGAVSPGGEGLCPRCRSLSGAGSEGDGLDSGEIDGSAEPSETRTVAPPVGARSYESDAPLQDPEEEPHAFGRGETLGNYEILESVGRGGMGVVYRARHKGLDREVALKVLSSLDATQEDRLRFQREARAVAKLRHPSIVPVYDVGRHQGRDYFTMDFVEGQTLHRIAAREKMTVPRCLETMRQVCEAIEYAHQQGIIHRDIKPSNVMVSSDQTPLVMDFGLAKDLSVDEKTLTVSGIAMGSPPYMSPEQARGDFRRVDRTSDVYGLGATLYELLCGRPPFTGRTVYEVIQRVLDEEPEPPSHVRPDVPREVEWICLKALEKNRRRRYRSALAMAEDINRYLAGEPVWARPVTLTTRIEKFVVRRKRELLAAACSTVVVLGLVWFALSCLWGLPSAWNPLLPEAETPERQVARLASPLQRLVEALDREPLVGWDWAAPELAWLLEPQGVSPGGAAERVEVLRAHLVSAGLEDQVLQQALRPLGVESASAVEAVEAMRVVADQARDLDYAPAVLKQAARAWLGGVSSEADREARAALLTHYLLGGRAVREHRAVGDERLKKAERVLRKALAVRPVTEVSFYLARDALFVLTQRQEPRAQALAKVELAIAKPGGMGIVSRLRQPLAVRVAPGGVAVSLPSGEELWSRPWPATVHRGLSSLAVGHGGDHDQGATLTALGPWWSPGRDRLVVVAGSDVLEYAASDGVVLARRQLPGEVVEIQPEPGGQLRMRVRLRPTAAALVGGDDRGSIEVDLILDARAEQESWPSGHLQAREQLEQSSGRRDLALAANPLGPALPTWLAGEPACPSGVPDPWHADLLVLLSPGELPAADVSAAESGEPGLDARLVLEQGRAFEWLARSLGAQVFRLADRAYATSLSGLVRREGYSPGLATGGANSPASGLAAEAVHARRLSRRGKSPARSELVAARAEQLWRWRARFAPGVDGYRGFGGLSSPSLYAGDLLARLCFRWGLIFSVMFVLPATYLRYRRMQRADLQRIGIRSLGLELRALWRTPSLRLRHVLLGYVSRAEKSSLLTGMVVFLVVVAVQDAMVETLRVRLSAPAQLFEAVPGHPVALAWQESLRRDLGPGIGRESELLLAYGHQLAGNREEAEAAYSRIAEQEPRALVNLGVMAWQADDVDAARSFFIAALKAMPQSAVARYDLALVEQDASTLDAARAALPEWVQAIHWQEPLLSAPTRSERDRVVLGTSGWQNLVWGRFVQLLLGRGAGELTGLLQSLYPSAGEGREGADPRGWGGNAFRFSLLVRSGSYWVLALCAAALMVAIALPSRPQPPVVVPEGARWTAIRLALPGVKRFMDGPVGLGALALILWLFLAHHLYGLVLSPDYRFTGLLTEGIVGQWEKGVGLGWPVWDWSQIREPLIRLFLVILALVYTANLVDVLGRRSQPAEPGMDSASDTDAMVVPAGS